MSDPSEEILDLYDVDIRRSDKLSLSKEALAVITKLVHDEDDIISAGIFGSRADSDLNPKKDSDIDLGVVMSDYDQDKISNIDFRINRKYRSIIEDDIEIETICFNDNIDHKGSESEKYNGDFRNSALRQMFIIKGSMSDFE